MPLFDYSCKSCGHVEEVLQKRDEPAPLLCPACGEKDTMAKAVSLSSFQLKGGGWYKDLYASQPKSDDKKSNSPRTKKTTPEKNSTS